MMFSENVKFGLFLTMMLFGISSLATFILAQIYVKSVTPELWQQFFPGRSIGFAHDLKFHRFVDWFYSGKDTEAIVELSWFSLLWRCHWVANRLSLILSGLFAIDVFVAIYHSGMIGGWKFR
jgi:hypothetical protein